MPDTSRPPGFDPRPVSQRLVTVLEFAAILGLFLLGVIWFGGAYPNRDPRWFIRDFEAQPAVIRIYYYGQTRELFPYDAGYPELVASINAAIAGHTGYIESLHPHDDSLNHYQTRGYAIELDYAEPVLVHTRQYFPPAVRLMITLDGSFNYIKVPILFRGSQARYLPGGLALEATALEAVRAQVDQLLAQSDLTSGN